MAAQAPEMSQGRAPRWRVWLQVAAAAGALLLLSEALWLWQTWTVRDLLQPQATAASPR